MLPKLALLCIINGRGFLVAGAGTDLDVLVAGWPWPTWCPSVAGASNSGPSCFLKGVVR